MTTPEQFVYWLQGFLELTNQDFLNEEQTKKVKAKLNSVFHKVTPSIKDEVIITPPNMDYYGYDDMNKKLC